MRRLDELAALIQRERETLLSRWREQVRKLPSAQGLDTPTLNDQVPALLDELSAALRNVADQSIAQAVLGGSSPAHGMERYQNGFDIVEVVAEYSILRGCIHDLAESNSIAIEGQAFHILNRVFDEAIGLAVQTFATQQALELQRRRDEYLAFVTHDLRTPLSAIALAARVLDSSAAPGGSSAAPGGSIPMSRMLRSLHRNVEHLTTLVDRILKENANVQTESGVKPERRWLDLWSLVEELIHDLHPVAGTSSTQLLNRVPEDLSAYADASLLRRILQNLIANAITFTPRGEVEIGARQRNGAGVECWVRDNGAGIPTDRLQGVFDKHETTTPDDAGAGLGLAIVKTFVEAHGGTVSVESTEGVGSIFCFTLPARTTQAIRDGAAATPS
jgi:two-component system, OmpR family, phosphate regulon sensor histidine kinase PhoR